VPWTEWTISKQFSCFVHKGFYRGFELLPKPRPLNRKFLVNFGNMLWLDTLSTNKEHNYSYQKAVLWCSRPRLTSVAAFNAPFRSESSSMS
jgi:hypothetical protein